MAKTVDIDEEEYLRLKKIDASLGAIMAHPEGKLLAERAAKAVWPTAKTPNLDAVEEREKSSTELRKELDEFKKAQEAKDAEREKRETVSRLVQERDSELASLRREGWTEEGIAGVQKFAEEKGILDIKIAAAAFEKLHPPQAPITPGGGGSWNFMEPPADSDIDLKKLIETKGNSDQLVDKMAREAVTEMRTATHSRR